MSDNIEVMIYDDPNEVIKEIFEALLSRYQIGLETSIKGRDFMVSIYCITNVIRQFLNVVVHILILQTG